MVSRGSPTREFLQHNPPNNPTQFREVLFMSSVFREDALAGKTVFIAGASSGINLGIAVLSQ